MLRVMLNFVNRDPLLFTVDENGFLIGQPASPRLPAYFSINLHFERKFQAVHYLWAWRCGVDNITNNGNPNFVNNVYGRPQFLTYSRGQTRAFSVRRGCWDESKEKITFGARIALSGQEVFNEGPVLKRRSHSRNYINGGGDSAGAACKRDRRYQ